MWRLEHESGLTLGPRLWRFSGYVLSRLILKTPRPPFQAGDTKIFGEAENRGPQVEPLELG